MGLIVTHFQKHDLIETKKNLRTYLRFFNKNIDQGSILTNLLLSRIVQVVALSIRHISFGTSANIRKYQYEIFFNTLIIN